MKRHNNRERIKLALNPCPGRTTLQRQYIQRRVNSIAKIIELYLERTYRHPLKFLPDSYITPEAERIYVESRAQWEKSKRDSDGYITCMNSYAPRATNIIRVASWYRNQDYDLHMVVMPIVSPLPCSTWGALPLTRMQWAALSTPMIESHMHWTWVHAVQEHYGDFTFDVGKSFGWYMDNCKKLEQGHDELCVGKVIYDHVVRQYSDHVLKG